MRLLIIGAGVIGQVYAGRLAAAGHDVTVVARGVTGDQLNAHGIRLTTDDGTTICPVPVVAAPAPDSRFDCAVLAVRFDQLDSAMAAVGNAQVQQVVTMVNLPAGTDQVMDTVGRDRTVLAFPGVGGQRAADGIVRYREVRQQHTMVGRNGGAETPFGTALREAGFAVEVIDDMPAWLTTHAVFIAGVGAALLTAGGDSAALGRDRRRTAQMVTAVGDGFRALRQRGIQPVPAPLHAIFTTVPKLIAVPYWQRQLRGVTGTETIAPHIRATRETELPALVAAVREILGSSAPKLQELLTSAGL